MPRPVVPMRPSPCRSSRARSRAPCEGRINAALSASFKVSGVTATPLAHIASISATSAHGSTTTPLPMIDSLPGRTTPEGSSDNLYSTLPMTRVWPALCPPWKRTTTSARSDSQSTILPLPSSPHWAPTTATLPMLSPSAQRHRNIPDEQVIAAEPARFRPPIGGRFERGNDDPAGRPQSAEAGRIAAERRQHAARVSCLRQGPQDHVGVERKSGRRLGAGRIPGLVAAAAAELSKPRHGAGEKAEADPGMVFEAAILDRIDGDLQVRHRRGKPVEHRRQPFALILRPPRQGQPLQRGERGGGRAGGGQQPLQQRPSRAG